MIDLILKTARSSGQNTGITDARTDRQTDRQICRGYYSGLHGQCGRAVLTRTACSFLAFVSLSCFYRTAVVNGLATCTINLYINLYRFIK